MNDKEQKDLEIRASLLEEIQYGVREGMSHYAPNLYDYDAYGIFKDVDKG